MTDILERLKGYDPDDQRQVAAAIQDARREIERLKEQKDLWEARCIGAVWLLPDELKIGALQETAQRAKELLAFAKWRQVETPPKAGVRVLAYVPPYGAMSANIDKGIWHCHASLNCEAKPTHWMPLPGPPSV